MIDPKAIKPKRNICLVRLEKAEEKTAGGIYLPETAQDRKKTEHKIGTVLAVGPGKFCPELNRVVATLAEVGDKVIFDPPYLCPVRGHDDLFLIEDDALMATIK